MLAKIVCGVVDCVALPCSCTSVHSAGRRLVAWPQAIFSAHLTLHNEKSGVIAHANDRWLREGPLLYCEHGKNVIYLKGSKAGRCCRAENSRGDEDAGLLRT